MVSKQASARRRGAQFESDLVNYLRRAGLDSERLRLSGTLDEGDIVIREGSGDDVLYTVIEAKAERQYNFSGYVAEAALERKHFIARRGLDSGMVDGIAVVKRAGKSIGDSFVVRTLDQHLQIGSWS